MSALREVLAVFDIIVNDEQLEAGNKKLDTFVDKLKGIAGALAAFGVVKSIASFGEHVAEAAREVEFHAGRMEMQVDEYQRLSQVANNYGMTMENLQIANTLFVRALSNAGGVMGVVGGHSQHAAAAMKSLGLNAKQFKGQRLEQILPTIADAFQKIDDPLERVTTGLNLFGHRGRSIMPMMAVGGDELRRQFAAAVPVFEQLTIKSADEATIAGKQLSRTWDNLIYNSFGRALLDMSTAVAKKLTDIVLVVKDLTKYSEIGKGTVIALGAALTTAAVMIIAAWFPVLAPILAILAAFTALAIVIDDFIVFMKGGDSVIGDFFDELLGPGGAEKAQQFIKDMWDQFKEFIADVKATAIPEFINDFKHALEEIRNTIHQIKSAWNGLKGFADFVANKTGLTDENISSAWGKVTALGGSLVQGTGQLLGLSPTASTAPPPSVTAPFSAVPRDERGTGAMLSPTYTFPGAIDARELANKVRRVVDDHHETKVNQILNDAFAAAGGAK